MKVFFIVISFTFFGIILFYELVNFLELLKLVKVLKNSFSSYGRNKPSNINRDAKNDPSENIIIFKSFLLSPNILTELYKNTKIDIDIISDNSLILLI